MTVDEILEQVKTLSIQERDELVHRLLEMRETTDSQVSSPKTGAEIVAMLSDQDPIDLVDADIEDPVEWVKAQRRKRQDKLKPYWDDES